MSKKIDIKRTLGNPTPPLSIEAVEEMTRLIHNKPAATPSPVAAVTAVVPPIEIKKEKAVKPPKTEKAVVEVALQLPEPPAEPSKRGRKPKLVMETERLIRVSVDLPESVFIDLKVLVIQQKTDLKSYIRQMVEREMSSRK